MKICPNLKWEYFLEGARPTMKWLTFVHLKDWYRLGVPQPVDHLNPGDLDRVASHDQMAQNNEC